VSSAAELPGASRVAEIIAAYENLHLSLGRT
jgi:hypothetical protein